MANAFVYGGQGAPRPTTFNVAPRNIADSYSQQRMPQPMGVPGAGGFVGGGSMAGGQPSFGTQQGGGSAPPWLHALIASHPAFSGGAGGAAGAGGAGGGWDPNQPFANVPDLQSGIRGTLANGGAAFGPDYLRNVLRQRVLSTGRNQRRRGDVLARLAGLDPMQQRQAMLEMDQQASGNEANALNEADLQGAQGYQEWLQRLLSGERSGEMGTLDRQAQERFQRSMRPSFGGQLLGSAVGIGSSLLSGGLGHGGGTPSNSLRDAANYTPELPAYRPPSYSR